VFYTVDGRPWEKALHLLLGWAPWPPPVIAGLLAALLLSGLMAAWVQAREAVAEPASNGPPSSSVAAIGDEDPDVMRATTPGRG
jgi:hypothetical protein